MTKDVDKFMEGLYKDGETSVTKEKVNLLGIFLQRAFPSVTKKAIADASALLAVYCCLITEGKHISVNGKQLDASGVLKLFDSLGERAEGEFDSKEAMYEFYGSAFMVALFVYKYTNGFTNKDIIFSKSRAGDKSDRMAAGFYGDEIR